MKRSTPKGITIDRGHSGPRLTDEMLKRAAREIKASAANGAKSQTGKKHAPNATVRLVTNGK